MGRMNIILSKYLLLLGCCAAQADGGMFIFPHSDQNQPTDSPTTLSFGTLLESTPPGLQQMQDIPAEFLHSHMAQDHPVRRLLEEGFTTRASAVANELHVSSQLNTDLLDEAATHLQSSRLAASKLDLGVALYADGAPKKALPHLKQGLERLRREHDWFSQRWLGPMIALGLSQQKLGQHEDANRSLARAQHLIQRHYGARDLRQLPLLLARAMSLDALDESFDTEQLYRTHLKLVQEQDTPHSSRRLAATHLLAEWLVENGQHKKAISAFNTLIDAQKAASGDDRQPSVELATLITLSQIYLRQGDLETDRGLRLANRASDFVKQNAAAIEPMQQVQTHLFTGDWLTLFGRRREAAKSYALAWGAASRSPMGHNLQQQMATPSMIFDGPEVPLSDMGYQWANQHAYANFRMSVNADGRPARVHLINTNMHSTTIRQAQQLMRKARFRPALVDGKPVKVTGIQHNRIYNTEPYEGFGKAMLGGLSSGDLN